MPEQPVDPHVVSRDNALVEITRTRRAHLVTDRVGRLLAGWCADVDATPTPERAT